MVRPLFFILDPVPEEDPTALTRYSLPASKDAVPVMTSFSLILPLDLPLPPTPVRVLFNSRKSLGGSPILTLSAKTPEFLGLSSVLSLKEISTDPDPSTFM